MVSLRDNRTTVTRVGKRFCAKRLKWLAWVLVLYETEMSSQYLSIIFVIIINTRLNCVITVTVRYTPSSWMDEILEIDFHQSANRE